MALIYILHIGDKPTEVVTHADYRALEGKNGRLKDKLADYEDICTERNTEIKHLREELAALRGKVRELTSAAKDMSNVLTQAMLNKPIPVHRSANAIQRVESALEALT